MGLDGGFTPRRPEMVHTADLEAQKKAKREHLNSIAKAYWTRCVLSGKILKSPIIVSPIHGALFNKEDAFQCIADNTIPKRFRHLKKRCNRIELDLLGKDDLVSYQCPLSGKTPSPSSSEKWKVLPCGHLFLKDAIDTATGKCPICDQDFTEEKCIILATPKVEDVPVDP